MYPVKLVTESQTADLLTVICLLVRVEDVNIHYGVFRVLVLPHVMATKEVGPLTLF